MQTRPMNELVKVIVQGLNRDWTGNNFETFEVIIINNKLNFLYLV